MFTQITFFPRFATFYSNKLTSVATGAAIIPTSGTPTETVFP